MPVPYRRRVLRSLPLGGPHAVLAEPLSRARARASRLACVFVGIVGADALGQTAIFPGRHYPYFNGATALDVGDVTGDGLPDAIGNANYGYGFVLLQGDGAGYFLPSQALATTAPLGKILLVDLNGDGLLDAVGSTTFNDSIVVLLNQGAARSEPQ